MAETKLDVLAIGAHPDDVELACGGTLALLASAGAKVGVLHLTEGERGSRGSREERRSEALEAARVLGTATLDFLDCGDGGLRTGEREEDAVIDLLRRRRPELVLGPAPSDRHPDHGRAHRLVAAACFYSGLAQRGAGEPHRPAALFCYMQHDPFEPRFIVDVTEHWPTKLRALAAYATQLYREGGPGGPATKVASREFALALEGRARHYGLLVGAEYGEPFWSRLPVAVRNPLELLPGGIR